MQVEGQHCPTQEGLVATGARVSNAYATYPALEKNPEKFGLILHNDIERHLFIFKALAVRAGHA